MASKPMFVFLRLTKHQVIGCYWRYSVSRMKYILGCNQVIGGLWTWWKIDMDFRENQGCLMISPEYCDLMWLMESRQEMFTRSIRSRAKKADSTCNFRDGTWFNYQRLEVNQQRSGRINGSLDTLRADSGDPLGWKNSWLVGIQCIQCGNCPFQILPLAVR